MPKPVGEYVRPPRCHYCGGPLRSDRRHKHKERSYRPCCCFGYYFPHRPASKHCEKNPTSTGDGYYRERYGVPDVDPDWCPF